MLSQYGLHLINSDKYCANVYKISHCDHIHTSNMVYDCPYVAVMQVNVFASVV